MSRRTRPAVTSRSEHWLRVAVNERTEALNARIAELFGFGKRDRVRWLSPIAEDGYAEYFDQEFLDRLGPFKLKVPLRDFWPKGGPRWDGLAKTDSGKLVLVEAKAYIEEAVDYGSKATVASLTKIRSSLEKAKRGFKANPAARWEAPFYQYANRLAHLYFLRQLNGLDAHLLFLYFADADDVPEPCSAAEWRGAERLMKKALGLGSHPYTKYVRSLIVGADDLRAA